MRNRTRDVALAVAMAASLALASPLAAHSADECLAARCFEKKQREAELRSRLRSAHRHAQGERWEAELRRIRDYRRRFCRGR